ncbi:hypothetical protein AWB74_01525 [Caballeronia arvi]|uniref:Uncharacterized protein n=1 Tax=Caballeronia arvi TaxID=1777135 RepID=A0A158H1Z3_9BURK|nr:hypothetical protein [Caballeronia arvi]SAL38336.1 hypothetical protein AWB74_01525 [Caballeronia arvi]
MRHSLLKTPASVARQAKPSIEQVRQSAFDFMVAVNEVSITSRTLPPVRGLQAGLLPAWRAFAHTLEQCGYPKSLSVHNRSDYGLHEANEACSQMILHASRLVEPQDGRTLPRKYIFSLSSLAGLAALYLTRSHAVIEPTDALQAWLARTDIGDDIPASLFRLPLGAIFLRVGAELRQTIDPPLWASCEHPSTTQGVYIHEALVENRRELMFVAVRDSALGTDAARGVRILIEDENESLLSAMRRMQLDLSSDLEDFIPMVEHCVKVMLYLQAPAAIRINDMRDDDAASRLTRVGSKKATRIERKVASRYNRIIVGPAQIPGHTGGEVAPHWRRGHMRMQAHGPQFLLRKLMFIAPALIRADRLNDSGTVTR